MLPQTISCDGTMTAKSPWILSSWQDLLLFVGTPLLVAPLVLHAGTQWNPADVALFVSCFGAMGHHLPGLLRAYGDRSLFRRYRVRFILAPVLVFSLCALFAVQDLIGVLLVMTVWGVWHFLMQTYGFARIYDAKVGCFDATTRRLDWAICVAWFGACIIFSPGRLGELLMMTARAGLPLLSADAVSMLRIAWAGATAVITVLFVANTVRLWRAGQPLSWVKLLLLAVTFSFFWSSSVLFANLLVGIAMFEVFHDVQYLSVVWMYNRNRADKDPQVGGLTRFLFRRSGALIGVYVGLVFAYGSIAFVTEEIIASEQIKQLLLALIAASNLLHYYYDGFIWKVRDPSTRESLGVDGKSPTTEPLVTVPGLVHALKWGALASVVAGLAFLEKNTNLPLKERTAAVVDAVPNFVRGRNQLADFLIREGQIAAAAEHYRRSIAAEPRRHETHLRLGVVLASEGKIEEAIREYERALELCSRDAYLRYQIAVAYLRAGRMPQAVEHLTASLEIDPTDANVHHNLGVVRMTEGRLEDAAEHFLEAIRIRPDHTDAHFGLAGIYVMLEQPEAAVPHYRQILESDPGHVDAHCNLAAALHAMGDIGRASQHYQEAVRLLIAGGLGHPARVRQAVAVATWLVENASAADPRTLDLLAWTYAAAGRFDEAAQTSHRAAELAEGQGAAQLATEIKKRNESYRQRILPPWTPHLPHHVTLR